MTALQGSVYGVVMACNSVVMLKSLSCWTSLEEAGGSYPEHIGRKLLNMPTSLNKNPSIAGLQ